MTPRPAPGRRGRHPTWAAIFAAIIAPVLAACSGNANQLNPAAAQDAGGGGPSQKDEATVQVGQQAVVTRKCVDCHGASMAGQTTPLSYPQDPRVQLYPPNLTPDPATGIGGWTDDQIANAIRNGQDKDGLELCPEMQHFVQMNDYEAYSIVKYLRSLPAVAKAIPGSICPPLKTGS